MIKIGFYGVHGGSKSATLYGVAHLLKCRGISVEIVKETAKEAFKCGFPINKDTTLETQLWILVSQIKNELEAERSKADVILCDRTVLDQIIYTKASPNVNDPFDHLRGMTYGYMATKPYDKIFIFSPLDNLEEDGVREIDKEWQKIIEHYSKTVIGHFLTCFSVYRTVYYMQSKDKERMAQEVFDVLVKEGLIPSK